MTRTHFVVAVFSVSFYATGCKNRPYASAFRIESETQSIGGPKAAAQVGDFILENDKIRVAILGARNSMGPGLYGGSILDADLQGENPGNDQLAELFPTVNLNLQAPLETSDVRVLAAGNRREPAIIRVEGGSAPFLSLLNPLWSLVGQPDWGVVTDYILEPGKSYIRIRTTATAHDDGTEPIADGELLSGTSDAFPVIEWGIESGVALGDFFLQGGSIDVFAPGIGFDEDGAVFEAESALRNTIQDPFQFEFVAGTGDGVSYGLAPATGNAFIPLFTSSQTAVFGAGKAGDGTRNRFAPGEAFTYERYFFVGNGDVGSIVDSYLEAREITHGTLQGTVNTEADVFVYRVVSGKREASPYSVMQTDEGAFCGDLPLGIYDIIARLPGQPNSAKKRIEIRKNRKEKIELTLPKSSTFRFSLRDPSGIALPGKITLYRQGDSPTSSPVLGDGSFPNSVQSIVSSMDGEGEILLPPGEYRAIASRGTEYELSEFSFELSASPVEHTFILERSVDTSGWISADFHVHSFPSHDTGLSFKDRLASLTAAGVEFFSTSDHDFLTDFSPSIAELGVSEWINSTVGNELTTIESGHFLGFPLAIDEAAEAQGAMDWTGKTPLENIESYRSAGERVGFDPFVFVAHPRDGILGYFDQFGFEPGASDIENLEISTPFLSLSNPILAKENFTLEFDGLEVLNSKRMEAIRTPTSSEVAIFGLEPTENAVVDWISRTLDEQAALEGGEDTLSPARKGTIDDWFSLLNLGYRITAMGNSDTHGWSSEAGCPRNYVFTDEDDPVLLDDQEVADAMREHRVVASYGPFVRFWIDNAGIGSEIRPTGEELLLSIEVQAPSWMDVDRVELYENGRLLEEFTLDDEADVTRFSQTLPISPEKDSWYAVIALGNESLSPVCSPVEIPVVDLQKVVTEALSEVPSVSYFLSSPIPLPNVYPVYPFAITNPIWVDIGDVGWQPPGNF